MAGKNQKKTDDPVEKIVDDLQVKLDEDRSRVSKYLTNLISSVNQVNDPLTTIAAADAVAKLSDALTRQNNLRVESVKSLVRRGAKRPTDAEGVFDEIGRPFDDEADQKDGSN